ncbi:hypothetical protein [Latilactobacillus graminis]|uniref:Uncharacterized protein n=2 Tax=Latilactobacillus graminis TaxID=60519 RepID=A0AA89I2W8_9LACO|nr:hypothetical protein [Latilactobacillus graminis]KRM24518.1 hypothetical protein FC90_GL000223 [Latilactobacillus graminis DSM 20719]QFP79028.1 hypothetical protein LG542_01725 [Latilactobacillus graminis]
MMTKDQTLMVLMVLKKKLQGVRFMRVIEEVFSLYVIFKFLAATDQVEFLGVSFTEGRAISLMFLLLAIDLSLSQIRLNYKRMGQQLIASLKDLTEQEALFIQKFQRF